MSHDVFISYANENKKIADAVCAKLEERGVRCWIAPRDILPGTSYAASIVQAIDETRSMVLVFSSEANRSEHIKREAERAVHDGIPIVPFRIEDVEPSAELGYFFGSHHWLDAVTPPLEQHIFRLADAIKVLIGDAKPHVEGPQAAQDASAKYCGSCGAWSGPNAQFCKQCGAAVSVGGTPTRGWRPSGAPSTYSQSKGWEQPYAEYPAPQEQSPAATQYQGVGIRYGTLLLDWIVLLIFWWIFFAIVSQFYNDVLFWWLAAPCVYLLYFIALEGTYGKSFGKMATRIKVVKEDGSPITYREAAMRAFGGILDGLPIIIPGFLGIIFILRSDKKQRFGDLVAHTVVVRAK